MKLTFMLLRSFFFFSKEGLTNVGRFYSGQLFSCGPKINDPQKAGSKTTLSIDSVYRYPVVWDPAERHGKMRHHISAIGTEWADAS